MVTAIPTRTAERSKATRGVIASLALSLALMACDGTSGQGPGQDGSPSGAERELADLPGVSSAEVAEGLIEQDVPGTVVAVDVESDITEDELALVFARIDELAPDDWVVTLDCGPATWQGAGERDGCDTATGSVGASVVGAPEQGARALLAAARHFPAATITVTSRRDVRVQLGEPGAEPVESALDQVLTDPVLRAVEGLTVAAAPGPGGLRFTASTDEPLAPQTLALWRWLGPTVDRLPAGTPGSFSVTVDERGEVTVTADVQLPGVALPEQMTPQRYGPALWPYLRAQLAVVADLPGSASYAARNAYRPVADARPHGNDPFLAVTVGQPARPDDLGRTWNVEAERYLAKP